MGILARLVGIMTGNERRPANRRPASLYRGVQIIACDEGSCRAAGVLAGQRFLADEIPKLPLDQCDATNCQCTYKLFDDRRTGDRRLSDFGYDVFGELRTDPNKRGDSGDRRGRPENEAAIRAWITSAFR